LADADITEFVRGFDNRSVEYLNLTGLLLLPAPYVLGRRLSSVLLRVAFRFEPRILAVRPSLHDSSST